MRIIVRRSTESPPAEISELPRTLSAAETQAFRTGNDFGFELLRRLYADRSEDVLNVFVSPLSLSMSLGMLMNGAGGKTFSAIGDALGLNGLVRDEANEVFRALTASLMRPDPGVEFRLANTSWLDEGFRFRRDYRNRVQESFDARIESVRFEESHMADTINHWVGTATEGRIPALVTAEEFKGMLALLVNTIYFKGEWTDPFDPAEIVTVDFRHRDRRRYRHRLRHPRDACAPGRPAVCVRYSGTGVWGDSVFGDGGGSDRVRGEPTTAPRCRCSRCTGPAANSSWRQKPRRPSKWDPVPVTSVDVARR